MKPTGGDFTYTGFATFSDKWESSTLFDGETLTRVVVDLGYDIEYELEVYNSEDLHEQLQDVFREEGIPPEDWEEYLDDMVIEYDDDDRIGYE